MSESPSIARIVSIVRELGSLADDVVFIGGAIAPLLHTDSVLPRTRPTKDVDGVIDSHKYGDSDRLHRTLRELGFVHDTSSAAHMHRWIARSGVLFDLVPAGDHAGGSGNAWDAAALSSAIAVTIEGSTFRHASAPAFIAMKVEAFNDRGEGDARSSHDIEDVAALIACRPSIVSDVEHADPAVRARVSAFASNFMNSGIAEEILAAHLNNADDVGSAVRITGERIEAMALLGSSSVLVRSASEW